MSATAESLALLLRIALAVEKLAGIESPKPTFDDSDLDSQYGNEAIKMNPRDWTGGSMKAAKMSDCPPAFLDLYASSHDFFARKNEESGATTSSGKPKHVYDQRTARRARGWAARLRGGWTAPSVASDETGGIVTDGELGW